VIDPFTNPTVITGSHNFSQSASQKNDENLVIVHGDKGLAERYAVNIMGVYQHYRWRDHLKQTLAAHRSPWRGLQQSDTWQQREASKNREISFWVR
jgi:phosphatidylserine/phosphatidylglycerophosphate/cardiolipin synthase-like enzyme